MKKNSTLDGEILQGFSVKERYLVGVSGGLDSMCLLHFLHANGFENLTVCHVNHQLRGSESDEDEVFVRVTAEQLGYSFRAESFSVRDLAAQNGESIEAAARDVRYRFFAKISAETDSQKVLLAHHADDQVETVLIHFFRGTGLRGLGGIKKESCRVVDGVELCLLRPFLEVSRAEIEEYAAENEVPFREDSSNQSDFALRNRVRNDLLPKISEIFERDVRSPVLRLSAIARLEEVASSEDAEADLEESLVDGDLAQLKVNFLRQLSEAKRNRLLLRWLRRNQVADCGFAEVQIVSTVLMNSDRPAKGNLPGNCHVRRRGGVLFLEK